MTYDELYNKALCTLCLTPSEVEDYRPACEIHIPELKAGIPNAIIIWLKTGKKVVFIGRDQNHELKINYILRDCPEYGLPEGFCIIGF